MQMERKKGYFYIQNVYRRLASRALVVTMYSAFLKLRSVLPDFPSAVEVLKALDTKERARARSLLGYNIRKALV